MTAPVFTDKEIYMLSVPTSKWGGVFVGRVTIEVNDLDIVKRLHAYLDKGCELWGGEQQGDGVQLMAGMYPGCDPLDATEECTLEGEIGEDALEEVEEVEEDIVCTPAPTVGEINAPINMVPVATTDGDGGTLGGARVA